MKGAPGERIYEPVADIAKGGMGRVELVVRREGAFARIYAMKRLRPELLGDAEVRAMFVEEARIAGLIRHPNVVPVLDVGEDELGPYFVMDYVEGVPAWKPIVEAREAGRMLPVALCVEIARQAALGLAAAHELEGAGHVQLCVVHRDVSPHNIMLGFDGLVRVTDFGVARALDHRLEEDETALKGKLGYMSPEQIAHRPLDGRSDLFCLAIVLYELLTGRRMYPGERAEVFRRIRSDPPPDVRAVRPDVPPELAALISELLAKEPDQRPASAADVGARLEAIGVALRETGEELAVGPYLARFFGDERTRQRALLAAALERTDADFGLRDLPPAEASETAITRRRGPPRWLFGAVPAALVLAGATWWIATLGGDDGEGGTSSAAVAERMVPAEPPVADRISADAGTARQGPADAATHAAEAPAPDVRERPRPRRRHRAREERRSEPLSRRPWGWDEGGGQ